MAEQVAQNPTRQEEIKAIHIKYEDFYKLVAVYL